MSLTNLKAQLDAHLAARPVQPCPVRDMTPRQYSDWSWDLAEWADKKAVLSGLVESFGIVTPPLNHQPSCSPAADYQWRDMRRKRVA